MTPRQLAKRRNQIKYQGGPCAKHGVCLRYTRSGCCIECQAEAVKKLRESVDGYRPRAYYLGQWARKCKWPKIPPELDRVMTSWWLAGWNDRDIELCKA